MCFCTVYPMLSAKRFQTASRIELLINKAADQLGVIFYRHNILYNNDRK